MKKKNIVELIQQFKIRSVLVEGSGPEFEQVCDGYFGSTAPIPDARELNKTLRTPADVKK